MRYKIFMLLLIFGLATGLQAQEDAISKFFSNYMDDDQFTSVYISPKMFEMFAKFMDEEDEEELKSVVSDLKGLRILTTDINPQKYYEEAVKKISVKKTKTTKC